MGVRRVGGNLKGQVSRRRRHFSKNLRGDGVMPISGEGGEGVSYGTISGKRVPAKGSDVPRL